MRNSTLAIGRLRTAGLIEMSAMGEWEPSRKGDDTLEDLELLAGLAAARDERNAGGMGQRARAGRRPEQGNQRGGR